MRLCSLPARRRGKLWGAIMDRTQSKETTMFAYHIQESKICQLRAGARPRTKVLIRTAPRKGHCQHLGYEALIGSTIF